MPTVITHIHVVSDSVARRIATEWYDGHPVAYSFCSTGTIVNREELLDAYVIEDDMDDAAKADLNALHQYIRRYGVYDGPRGKGRGPVTGWSLMASKDGTMDVLDWADDA